MKNAYSIDMKTLQRLKTGDVDAFEYIFRTYNGKVYRFALAVLFDKSLAEDITQSVFLSVWEHRQEIDAEKNFQAYLYTIAKNRVYRETEKRLLASGYEEREKILHPSEADFSTQQTIDADLLEETILRLIDKLPEARRKIFLLHFKEDLNNKEIAKRLSISEKNVEMQVRRSREYLRRHLKDYIAFVALLYL